MTPLLVVVVVVLVAALWIEHHRRGARELDLAFEQIKRTSAEQAADAAVRMGGHALQELEALSPIADALAQDLRANLKARRSAYVRDRIDRLEDEFDASLVDELEAKAAAAIGDYESLRLYDTFRSDVDPTMRALDW